MFDTILVPLDGSAIAEAALAVAAQLPSRRLRLLTVRSDMTRLADVCASPQAGEAYLERLASAAREDESLTQENAYLDARALDLGNQDLMTTSEVRSGIPATELLAALKAGDVLVLATRDRGGLERWALGSVADEMVRHAPGPVLLVRGLA